MNNKFKTLCLFLLISIFAAAQQPVKIGFSVGDFSSDRWSQEPKFFEDEAKALGAEVLFEYAYGDAVKQLEQVRKLIQSGIKVLLVFPTSTENWIPVVEEAHKAGIQVIAYERMLKDAPVDYFFSFQNEGVGRQQAQYAVDRRPKGNYLLLGGPTTDLNSLLFMKGQKEVLKPYIDKGDIKIVFEKHLNTWNAIDAFTEVQSFLNSTTQIDAILAANDDLAGGALMALDMASTEHTIIITGQDATAGGCQSIIDGKQSMTVYKSIYNLAKEAARTAVKLAKDEPIIAMDVVNNGVKDIPAVLLKTIAVDKSNIKETVIADGFIKADQLNWPKE